MTVLPDPAERLPKGDHNRRLALGMDVDAFAAEAGVTPQELRDYEGTGPNHDFDVEVVGESASRLSGLR